MEITRELLELQNQWWRNPDIGYDPVLWALSESPFRYRPSVIDEIRLDPGSIAMLTGSRGSGKTSILKTMIRELIADGRAKPADVLYYSCRNLSTREQLNEIIKIFLRSRNSAALAFVFLDEVRSVPAWERGLRNLKEAGLLSGVSILASSSCSAVSAAAIRGEGLLGMKHYPAKGPDFRSFVYIIDPAAADALADDWSAYPKYAKQLAYFLDIYLLTGSHLPAITSFARDAHVGQEVYDSYIDRLLFDLVSQGRDPVLLRQIMEGVIGLWGAPAGYLTLSKKTKAQTHNTIGGYIDLLESFFVLHPQYQAAADGRLRHAAQKKLWFRDPFVFWAIYGHLKGSLNHWRLSCAEVMDARLHEFLCRSLIFEHLSSAGSSPCFERVGRDVADFLVADSSYIVDIGSGVSVRVGGSGNAERIDLAEFLFYYRS